MNNVIFQEIIGADEVEFFGMEAGSIQTDVFEFTEIVDVVHRVFGNESEDCFRGAVFEGDGNVGFFAEFGNFSFEPLDLFKVGDFGGLDDDNAVTDFFGHFGGVDNILMGGVLRGLEGNYG